MFTQTAIHAGFSPAAGIPTTMPPYYLVLMITTLLLNIFAQGFAFWIKCRRRPLLYMRGFLGHAFGSQPQLEILVFIVSLITNAFFLTRILPTWSSDQACFIFRGAVMAIFELQMAAYSCIQMQRFGVSMLTGSLRRRLPQLVGTICVALAIFSGIYQNGYIDTHQVCHFLHDWRVTRKWRLGKRRTKRTWLNAKHHRIVSIFLFHLVVDFHGKPTSLSLRDMRYSGQSPPLKQSCGSFVLTCSPR